MPARIALFVIHNNAPGIVRVLLNLAQGFLARGHAVDWIDERPESHAPFALPEGVRAVPFPGAGPLPETDKLPPAQRLAQYLKDARPDAVLAAGHPANLAALRARTLAESSTRIVVSTHMTVSAFMRHNTVQLQRMAREIHQFYPQADARVAVSQGVAEDLAELTRLPRESISVIPNPATSPPGPLSANGEGGKLPSPPGPLSTQVERGRTATPSPGPFPPFGKLRAGSSGEGEKTPHPPAPSPQAERGREAHPWLAPGEPPVLLGSGRLAPQKDFITLLNAFARARQGLIAAGKPGARLIVLGDGPERERLIGVAAQLGVGEAVAFPGFVSDPFAYLRGAALFVLSSIHEGMPNVMLEALACGTPIVSTDCPSGPRELLLDGRLGALVPVRNSEALAQAILAALANPVPAEALLRRAADFALGPIADRYLELLLGKPG